MTGLDDNIKAIYEDKKEELVSIMDDEATINGWDEKKFQTIIGELSNEVYRINNWDRQKTADDMEKIIILIKEEYQVIQEASQETTNLRKQDLGSMKAPSNEDAAETMTKNYETAQAQQEEEKATTEQFKKEFDVLEEEITRKWLRNLRREVRRYKTLIAGLKWPISESLRRDFLNRLEIKQNSITDAIRKDRKVGIDDTNKIAEMVKSTKHLFYDIDNYTENLIASSKPLYHHESHQSSKPRYYKNLSPEDKKTYDKFDKQIWSTNSWIKAIGKVIDEKATPRLNNHLNEKWTKTVTWAMKVWLLVANGVMLRNMGKNLFNLVFKGKDKWKYFSKFLTNAGFFTALNYVDPDKALSSLKDTRARITGKETKNKEWYFWSNTAKTGFDLSKAKEAIDNKSISEEEKIKTHGTIITGLGLCGISYWAAKNHNIFTQHGNTITGINTSNLRQYYNTQFKNNSSLRNQFIDYVENIEEMNKKDPKLLQKILKHHNITPSSLDDPNQANTIIGSQLGEELRKAIITIEGLTYSALRQTLEAQIPAIETELWTDQYDDLLKNITKLPEHIKQEIIDWDIEFKLNGGKLILAMNHEYVVLNIQDNTLALFNAIDPDTPLEFPEWASSISELLMISYEITKAIHTHKWKFLIDKPLYYDQSKQSILATKGSIDPHDTDYDKKSATETIFQTNWTNKQLLEKFKEHNILDQFSNYLNDLLIRKWNATHYNSPNRWQSSQSWGQRPKIFDTMISPVKRLKDKSYHIWDQLWKKLWTK